MLIKEALNSYLNSIVYIYYTGTQCFINTFSHNLTLKTLVTFNKSTEFVCNHWGCKMYISFTSLSGILYSTSTFIGQSEEDKIVFANEIFFF